VEKLWTTRAKLVENLRTQKYLWRDVSAIDAGSRLDVAFAWRFA